MSQNDTKMMNFKALFESRSTRQEVEVQNKMSKVAQFSQEQDLVTISCAGLW